VKRGKIEPVDLFMTTWPFFVRIAAPAFAGMALLAAPAGAACRVPRPRAVCAEYANSQAVATARLQSIRQVTHGAPDRDGTLYTFVLRTQFRGTLEPTFQVWDKTSGGTRPLAAVAGEDYLLFLTAPSGPDRAWVFDACGNSAPLSRSAATIAGIRTAQTPAPDGVVYGMVVDGPAGGGVPDVAIKATGNNLTFSATTIVSGVFLLRLPVAKYALEATREGKSFAPDLLSYENPRELNVTPGYCAQVQFNGAAGK
jgi:hypothetical protein